MSKTERQPTALLTSLTGRIALVTGGNRGIGLAIATALVNAGAQVIVTGRDVQALKRAGKSLGANATPVRCDVRNIKDVKALFTTIKKRFGKLDFLINNAGTAHELKSIAELPLDTWHAAIDANLTGLFFVTQTALPLMSAGGVIVNNLSIAALQPFSGMAAYNAAKAGALGFTNTLRLELRSRGIRVTALVPGAVDTEIWRQFWPDAPRDKMLSPVTVAEAVLHVLRLPSGTTIEQLHVGPTSGAL